MKVQCYDPSQKRNVCDIHIPDSDKNLCSRSKKVSGYLHVTRVHKTKSTLNTYIHIFYYVLVLWYLPNCVISISFNTF